MIRLFPALSSLCALAVAAATLGPGPSGGDTKRIAPGTWGANGIAMEVTAAGGRIEYDCAHGTIGGPILLDTEGRFDVRGRHFPEHGGPVRDGEESNGQPVRYTGQVSGDTMTLAVTPEGSGTAISSHTLVRGKTGRLHKCL
jgi:hypothetical protein